MKIQPSLYVTTMTTMPITALRAIEHNTSTNCGNGFFSTQRDRFVITICLSLF